MPRRRALFALFGGVAALSTGGVGQALAGGGHDDEHEDDDGHDSDHPRHCRDIGNSCRPDKPCCFSQACIGGKCACPQGSTNHDGVCVCTGSGQLPCNGVCCADGRSCNAGVCSGMCCGNGLTNCNGTCINTATSTANCGACGHACPAGSSCVNGSCSCVPATCGPASCGSIADGCGGTISCGNCPSGSICQNSACVAGCTTNADCGVCQVCSANKCIPVPNGTVCAGGVCNNGVCTACPSGTTLCNGACVNTGSDPANCGNCGHVCPSGTSCVGGVCQPRTCSPVCDSCHSCDSNGVCQPKADGTACGSGGQVCVAGMCVCPVGMSLCGTICVNVATDPNNCGACGTVCSAANGVPGCANGKCVIVACNAGFADCNGNPADGCETNIRTDPRNCGVCGVVCPAVANGTGGCANGVCIVATCNAGFADCNGNPADGCETNIRTDPRNCGVCGVVCPAVANGTGGCANGVCIVASCNAGFRDCNGVVADGCETNTNTDPNNCGACGHKCVCGVGTPICVNGLCACQ